VDEAGPIVSNYHSSIHRDAPLPTRPPRPRFCHGLKVIDLLCPLYQGGKIGLIGGAGWARP